MLFVKKIGQRELSSEAKRSTRVSEDFPHFLNRVHSFEETSFLDNMSAPWLILPGTCVAFSERRLV